MGCRGRSRDETPLFRLGNLCVRRRSASVQSREGSGRRRAWESPPLAPARSISVLIACLRFVLFEFSVESGLADAEQTGRRELVAA